MEMTFTIGNLITIGTMIVGIAIAWGVIKTKTQNTDLQVNRIQSQCKECRSKVNMEIQKMSQNQHTIEQRIYSQIAQIKAIMSKQTTALEVLATKVQYFIKSLTERQGRNNV